MNAPDAVAPIDPFRREGQGGLPDPEHRLPSRVTGYAVLDTQRAGDIPRPSAAPPGSSGVVTLGQPVTGKRDAAGGQLHPANISAPPGKLQTATEVAVAPASASSPPTFGPVRAWGGP